MFISKKRLEMLEKRIVDLEERVQRQKEEINLLVHQMNRPTPSSDLFDQAMGKSSISGCNKDQSHTSIVLYVDRQKIIEEIIEEIIEHRNS